MLCAVCYLPSQCQSCFLPCIDIILRRYEILLNLNKKKIEKMSHIEEVINEFQKVGLGTLAYKYFFFNGCAVRAIARPIQP